MAVPVGLLVIQIASVNYFVRELQSAVAFISSAHTVIESDFVAVELVSTMRESIKRLPSRYVNTPTESTDSDDSLRPDWDKLISRMGEIQSSDAIRSIEPEIVNDVSRALEAVSSEYELAEQAMTSETTDLDTLIERAIFIDKALEELSSALDVLAVELRKQLQVAVDREREIHNRPAIAGIAIGGLAVFLLLGFAWLYVDRNFVARLTALGRSTLSIAGGDLKADIPETSGNDEVSEMAESLKIFRDTAVEVEENNLREIATARQRLVDAIESISEGFSLYGKNDGLVLCNRQYRKLMYPGLENAIEPGISFGNAIQKAADAGIVADAKDRIPEWVDERLDRHRNPAGTFVQRQADARWIEVTEHKTSDGGTVAIYTDITTQKESEIALLEEKRRSEQANEQVVQKNAMLESLSTKLSKYLSPQVYSSIFSGAQDVEIASKRKKLTVMFSDIAGFTEMSDTLESEELTGVLNNYLTEMSNIALEYGATIDKYIGDAIMIFFGDPETRGVKNDAIACVKMAIDMQRQMRSLRQEWRGQGMENPFQLRIGINTGFCTVGNFGSEDRMDYTIIGSEVNLAARLQQHADLGEIIIAHETCSLVNDELMVEEQSPTTVKGFAKPVRNYRVLDHLADGEEQGRIIHVSRQGIKIALDLDRLSKSEKENTIGTMEEILAMLTNDESESG